MSDHLRRADDRRDAYALIRTFLDDDEEGFIAIMDNCDYAAVITSLASIASIAIEASAGSEDEAREYLTDMQRATMRPA